MMEIVLVGINHKTAPVEVRESLSFSQPALGAGLAKLYKKRSVEECLILSTCNRVEIYSVSENAEECVEEIKGFLSHFHKVPIEFFTPYLYVSINRSAFRHLFRVASSLDSMVIGEPQILGQVKEAYRTASLKRTTGLILNRLFHAAFSVAKRVRAETKIATQAVSVSYAAVQLSKRIFDDLSKRAVMLVGTGHMAELAAKHFSSAGIKNLLIASRTLESADVLAHKLGGKPIRIEEIHYFLKNVDIVITATGSPNFIIRPQHVHEALHLRKNEPMFMIDIAVPRDVDPRVEEVENVYLYDIDDLNVVIQQNQKIRWDDVDKAEQIILQGEKHFQRWLNGLKVVPTIIALNKRINEIKASEIKETFRRFGNPSDREKHIIEGLATGIIGKILHGPMVKLKQESSTSLGALRADMVRKLFDLDRELECLDRDENQTSIQKSG